jgi:hypothetical protein
VPGFFVGKSLLAITHIPNILFITTDQQRWDSLYPER